MRARSVTVALAAALAVVVVVVLVAAPWRSAPARLLTPEQRASAARELGGHVEISVEVVGSSLGVTRASGDFGIEEGVRSVPVRIVEELELRVRLSADVEVSLAGPPRVCLVGPFWNPLDAGLSDRCWGEPDLAEVVATELPAGTGSAVTLAPGAPIELAVTVGRGQERCDYAPGEWRLQVDAQPVIDGAAADRVDLADLPFEVPLEARGTALPFRPNPETRPCSYPAAVFTRQGEPRFEEP